MNEKENQVRTCPDCGKKIKSAKTSFCPACGWELFTPKIKKSFEYKLVAAVFLILAALYFIYLAVSPVLYFYLDKV
jgi:uncharacterized paraquat-inducible protein A